MTNYFSDDSNDSITNQKRIKVNQEANCSKPWEGTLGVSFKYE